MAHRLIRHPFVITILALSIAGLSIFAWTLHHYDLSPRDLIAKAAQRLKIDPPWLERALAPPPAYSGFPMDGFVRASHPRILLPQLASWNGNGAPELFLRREAAYKTHGIKAASPCQNGGLLGRTACWLVTGNVHAGRAALNDLRKFQTTAPHPTGQYGNAWELALAYDFLSLNPALSTTDRMAVQLKLQNALRQYLELLDGDDVSLWHGRATLAANAWLCAIELDSSSARSRDLIRRAEAHFIDLMQALALVDAWPEGYNYWIQSRAFQITLAASAYINGIKGGSYANDIRQTLRQVGLWTVYATRPDNRIEGYGDEGSRVDLKDETRRVIDIIVQLTGDPVLSTFSRYLGRIHGVASYYSGYRWGFMLFNDPDVAPVATIKPGQLQGLARILPRARIFGRGAMNMAYIRSGWGPDDTFISFHAGDIFTHHGHYDAGHFTIFKGAPLAVNSSTYGGFFTPNRLNYSIRTVAKNSLLIMRPGERVHPNRFFSNNVAGGGQRVVIPTGSSIRSVKDWRRNLNSGLHLKGGELLHFENAKGQYAYIEADLTSAYNTPAHDEGGTGGKVSLVRRSLLYLYRQDRLVVFDDVISTRASYTKKWLLHTILKPDVKNLAVLKGRPDDGILQSASHEAIVHNGHGYLQIRSVYPRDSIMRLVGGPDYRYYVDIDGDDRTFDGKNFYKGAKIAPWFDNADWRLELQPGHARKHDHFLVVLSPSLDHPRQGDVTRIATSPDSAWGFADARSIVLFTDLQKEQGLKFQVPGEQTQLYIIGLPPAVMATLKSGEKTVHGHSSNSGVLSVALPNGIGHSIVLTWN